MKNIRLDKIQLNKYNLANSDIKHYTVNYNVFVQNIKFI